ncbi:DEKNAAC100586 [Brettanomyces naardenensis]|uniref:DEKNAAC100587 n=1 Tax=Brettanomyces naardenensis TaxID=13370 RepID=A0A448YEN1_BRENA|nr:DEKNAAC100586 [Brettanomyces naardenensis]
MSELSEIPQPVLAGHRGFKAKYPENTILSYDAATDNGCDVVETDLHISTDKKIVIAHDVDTTRVFGETHLVNEESYDDVLSKLRTLREPHLPMPTFREILIWCREKSEKTGRNIQLMLDIKKDCEPKLLMELLLNDLKEVGPSIEYWHSKLIFGMWDSSYYYKEMDPFRIINIALDFEVSKKVVAEVKSKGGVVSAISIFSMILFNDSMFKEMYKFCDENNLKIWFWTINLKKEANDAVRLCKLPSGKSLLAGLITDDPVAASAKQPEALGISYNLSLFFRRHLYVGFLFLVHRKFNLTAVINLFKYLGLL